MRRNNWDEMPQEYHDHLAVCRWEDGSQPVNMETTQASRTRRRKLVLGWIHKALAFRPKYADIKAVLIAHRAIRRQWNRPWSMYEYRKSIPACEVCHKAKPVDTHHIVPRSKGGEDHADNYLAVCLGCHRELHKDLPREFFFSRRSFSEIASKGK